GVVEALGPGVMQAHVVSCPAGAELLAASGKLADQVSQVSIVRVSSRLGAHDGDGGVRGSVPVGVEIVRAGVEEVETGDVDRTGVVVVEHGGVERTPQRVDRQDVHAAVAYE